MLQYHMFWFDIQMFKSFAHNVDTYQVDGKWLHLHVNVDSGTAQYHYRTNVTVW